MACLVCHIGYDLFITQVLSQDPKAKDDRCFRISKSFGESIVDVQKTLVFFFSATAVAFFVTSHADGFSYIDWLVLMVLSLAGQVFISFVMLCILYYRKESWYTLIITLAGWIFCAVCFLEVIIKVEPPGNYIYGLSLCESQFTGSGDLISTTSRWVQAFNSKEYTHRPIFMFLTFAWSCVAMITCIVWKLKPQLSKVKFLQPVKLFFTCNPSRKYFLQVGGTILLIMSFFLAYAYLSYLAMQFLRAVQWHIKYPFGQVVAVAIWLPCAMDCENIPSQHA